MTAQRLSELLRYEPSDGRFTWIARRGQRVRPGDIAGHVGKSGYVEIGIDGRAYYGHRLAILAMTGEWPQGHVDHINGNRSDNRWTNLRDADRSVNMQNRRSPTAGNRAGFLGVHAHLSGKFAARIKVGEKNVYLGLFATAEAAHQAYVEAKRRLHAGGTL